MSSLVHSSAPVAEPCPQGTLRLAVRQVHLWLSLTVGALFALLGLTGSALVFYVEIDGWLHPIEHRPVSAPARDWASPVWDRAHATVRAQWPQAQGEWRFEASEAVDALPARYQGDGGHHARRLMVWLSPDGGRVLRHEPWGAYLMSWIYALHMHLLMERAGSRIVGWAGVAMLALLGTGLWAWWPRASWRKALAFKRRAVWQRRLRDLHKLTGLWSLGLLLILTATGALLALPDERDWLLARTLAPIDAPVQPLSPAVEGPSLPLSRLLDAAHRHVPEARLVWIEIPGDPSAPVRFRVQVPGDPSPRFPRSYIHVDRYSGAVVAFVDYRRSSASSAFATWLHPLHDGSVGGLPTRILAVLLGLAPAALFVTGLLHWRRRRSRARACHHHS